MKINDTLTYTIRKYSGYRKFKEVDPNFEIPDELEFMKRFAGNDNAVMWLGSLLENSRDLKRTYRILKKRFGNFQTGIDGDDSRVVSILKDIWVIECL